MDIDAKKEQEKELKEWDSLYQYVKYDVLNYDDDMNVPKFMILRLKGLRNGTFVANKDQKANKHYSFDVILMTFKACRQDILKYTTQNTFKDEKHKVNYIMVIIESNINDIALRLKRAQANKIRTEKIKVENTNSDESAQYKTKTEQTSSDILDNLW